MPLPSFPNLSTIDPKDPQTILDTLAKIQRELNWVLQNLDDLNIRSLKADAIHGGTLTLGGPNNGNGQAVVFDSSGNERARIDNTGVSVFDANFLLKDVRTQVPSAVSHVHNMLRDHSFEEVMPAGSPDPYQTFSVSHAGGWAVDAAQMAQARILSTYNTDLPKYALFDYQAAVIRHYNQVLWCQYAELDYSVGPAGPYTVSAWFAAFDATAEDTTAKIELWACDYNLMRIKLLATATVQIKASEKWIWKRTYATASNLPQDTWYLEVAIFCDPDTWILCDGVQLVPLPYPAVYNPESGVWRVSRAMREGFSYVPPSMRITRTSNQAIAHNTSAAIVWQGRRSGYNSDGFWNPSQPDPENIYIPEDGKYLITVNLQWSANSSGFRTASIFKNTTRIASISHSASSNVTIQNLATMVNCVAGDKITVSVYQNSGATVNIEAMAEFSPELAIIKVA